MKISYIIDFDPKVWNKKGALDIVEFYRETEMPSMRCPVCGVWSATGIYYPSIRSPEIKACIEQYEPIKIGGEDARFLDPDQFSDLRGKVRRLVRDERPIEPGTGFGPLEGIANGYSVDFSWIGRWILLARESVIRSFESAGISLIAIHADFKFKDRHQESIYEIQAIPAVRLKIDEPPTSCDVCGRSRIKKPDIMNLDLSTYDDSIPIQRISNLMTYFIVNDVFRNHVLKSRWKNLIFTPISVI